MEENWWHLWSTIRKPNQTQLCSADLHASLTIGMSIIHIYYLNSCWFGRGQVLPQTLMWNMFNRSRVLNVASTKSTATILGRFNIFHPVVSTLQLDFLQSWATRENWRSCSFFTTVLLDSDVTTSDGKGPRQSNKPSHSWSWPTPYPGLYKKPTPQQELSNNFCVKIVLHVVKISPNSGGWIERVLVFCHTCTVFSLTNMIIAVATTIIFTVN
jgi:hypothetical protein